VKEVGGDGVIVVGGGGVKVAGEGVKVVVCIGVDVGVIVLVDVVKVDEIKVSVLKAGVAANTTLNENPAKIKIDKKYFFSKKMDRVIFLP